MNTVITILAIIVLVIVIIIAISGSRNLRNFHDSMDDRFDKQIQNKYIDPDIVYAHNVVMSEAYGRPTYEEVMHCIKNIIDHKNSEFRNQEQSLLYTLYSILDGLAVEGEARDIAIKEFREHLINNDLQ